MLSDPALRRQYNDATAFDVECMPLEEYLARFKYLILTVSGLGFGGEDGETLLTEPLALPLAGARSRGSQVSRQHPRDSLRASQAQTGDTRTSMAPLPSLQARQHRAAVQRAVRRAAFELSQARSEAAAASAAGQDAALSLVNAHLSSRYAPEWHLPAAVAAQPGLLPAVQRKLAHRSSEAACALNDALARLQAAQQAMEAAVRGMCGCEPTAAQAQVTRASAAVCFDPGAFPDMVIYSALTLAGLGACCLRARGGSGRTSSCSRLPGPHQTRSPRRLSACTPRTWPSSSAWRRRCVR